MQRAKYYVTDLWLDKLLSQWVMSIMVAVHIALGMAVIVGGEARFSKPTYQPMIDLSGGYTWIWGVWILAAGCLMMSPSRWPNMAGLWLGMFWNVMWMTLFAVSVATYPTSAATAMVAYGGFAMINAALLTVRAMDKTPSKG